MKQLPTIVILFSENRVEVVTDVPARVIRVGEPGVVGHVWRMRGAHDPARVLEILSEAIDVMDNEYFEEWLRAS